MCKKTLIPSMEESEILKWYKTIKPIVRKENKPYFLRELSNSEVLGTAYIWINENEKYGEPVDMDSLCLLLQKNMFHSYLNYMFSYI